MSDDKRRIRFSLPATASSSSSIYRSSQPNYSLDVFDEKMQLVGRGTVRGGVDLAPGHTYYVSTALPDGQAWVSRVTPDADSTEFELRSVLADASAIPNQGQALDPSSDAFIKIGVGPSSEPYAYRPGFFRHPLAYFSATQVYAYSGNLLRPKNPLFAGGGKSLAHAADLQALEPTSHDSDENRWKLTAARTGLTYVQLLDRGHPVSNYAVPVAPGESCQIRLLKSATSGHSIDVVLDDPDDDLLLRYGGRYLFQEAAQVVEAQEHVKAVDGTEILRPIGAAVMAYVQLRLGEQDRLKEWTASLCRDCKWLPDGIPIRAEHQARLGNHAEALEVLLQLGQRGLPIFSSGLSYALDRLRQYRPFMGDALPGEGIETADALIAQLGSYASRTDFRRPILTFSGSDPRSPDAARIGLLGSFGRSVAVDFGWTDIPTRALFRE